MKISLAIYGAPYSSQASESAYQYAAAALDGGHEIYRIFFYGDGVHNASDLACPPQDESHQPQRWQQLADKHNIDMVVCIAAALRRGLLNQQEAERHEKTQHNLGEGFELSGLGQLVDASVKSDRLITFGA